jgi:hypothetical protein
VILLHPEDLAHARLADAMLAGQIAQRTTIFLERSKDRLVTLVSGRRHSPHEPGVTF